MSVPWEACLECLEMLQGVSYLCDMSQMASVTVLLQLHWLLDSFLSVEALWQVIHKYVIGGGLLYVGNLGQRRPQLLQLPNPDELTTLKFRRT